jgi:hypothetical protein
MNIRAGQAVVLAALSAASLQVQAALPESYFYAVTIPAPFGGSSWTMRDADVMSSAQV